MKKNINKKVFVSGCFDMLHSGHVEFLRQAAKFGDVYVGLGSDNNIYSHKHKFTLCNNEERKFMVESIKYVKKAFILKGNGLMDFSDEVKELQPDYFVVNEDGDSKDKQKFCKENNIEYIVLERKPYKNLIARSSTNEKKNQNIPTRLDLGGGWIDQPYLSEIYPGWDITISIEANFEIRKRCGLATSTIDALKDIWSINKQNINTELFAKLTFCYENKPGTKIEYISGAQDAIGICVPGLCRHYYDGQYWPKKIEQNNNEDILLWLEQHLCLIPLEPRKPDFDPLKNKDLTKNKIKNLADASIQCWDGIMHKNLEQFGQGLINCINAQTSLFPAMLENNAAESINKFASNANVFGYKLTGAGGGGYIILLCEKIPQNAIPIKIRRPNKKLEI